MNRTARRPSLLLAACVLAACGGVPGPPDATGDGAGGGVHWAPGQEWRVDPDPILEIGGAGAPGAAEFYDIARALLLGDGRIVVADRSSLSIRFYEGGGGRLLHAVGRRGGGPGEFASVDWIGAFRGDSLFAWDAASLRGTLIDSDGGFVRTVSIENSTGFPLVYVDQVFPDGTLLVRGGPPRLAADSAGDTWGFEYFGVFDHDGKHVSTIGMLPVDRCSSTSGLPCRPLLFAPRAKWAVGHGRLYFGRSSDYSIEVFDLSGGAVAVYRAAFSPRPVTPDDVRAEIRARRRGDAEDRVPADYFPAFDRMLTDPEENLWVRNYRSSTWSVFDSAGAYRGAVAMPPGLVVHQLGAEHVLGVARDALGVERIAVHRLVKPERMPGGSDGQP